MSTRPARHVWVAMVGLIIGLAVALAILSSNAWDPTSLVRFGAGDVERRVYAEHWLGPGVWLAPDMGHDGKFFFIQAMDPFFAEPDQHAVFLDRPTYRARRMLYPTLASLGGLLGPQAIVWNFVILNVLGMAAGTYFTSRVATELGRSAWLGLAFALNPGLIFELIVDGSGVLAGVFLMAAVFFVIRGGHWWGGMGLAAAALARETMILAAVGVGLFFVWKHRRLPHIALALPFLVLGGWTLYLSGRLSEGVREDLVGFDLPFAGFAKAMGRWLANPAMTIDLAVGILLMTIVLLVLYLTFKTPSILASSVVGLALLSLVTSEYTWLSFFDSLRILAPVVTAFLVLWRSMRKPSVARSG